jgi:hypothetical protein
MSPSDVAALLDLDASALHDACRRGSDCDGYPVADWVQTTSTGRTYLSVPDALIRHHGGLRGGAVRSNPSPSPAPSPAPAQTGIAGAAAAVAPALPAVSSHAAGAHAIASMSDAVREHPQLLEHITDALVLLGSGGLMLAATEEGEDLRALKVAGGSAAAFALWRMIRHRQQQQTQQQTQDLMMADREQRARIARTREEMQPKTQHKLTAVAAI